MKIVCNDLLCMKTKAIYKLPCLAFSAYNVEESKILIIIKMLTLNIIVIITINNINNNTNNINNANINNNNNNNTITDHLEIEQPDRNSTHSESKKDSIGSLRKLICSVVNVVICFHY